MHAQHPKSLEVHFILLIPLIKLCSTLIKLYFREIIVRFPAQDIFRLISSNIQSDSYQARLPSWLIQ